MLHLKELWQILDRAIELYWFYIYDTLHLSALAYAWNPAYSAPSQAHKVQRTAAPSFNSSFDSL